MAWQARSAAVDQLLYRPEQYQATLCGKERISLRPSSTTLTGTSGSRRCGELAEECNMLTFIGNREPKTRSEHNVLPASTSSKYNKWTDTISGGRRTSTGETPPRVDAGCLSRRAVSTQKPRFQHASQRRHTTLSNQPHPIHKTRGETLEGCRVHASIQPINCHRNTTLVGLSEHINQLLCKRARAGSSSPERPVVAEGLSSTSAPFDERTIFPKSYSCPTFSQF